MSDQSHVKRRQLLAGAGTAGALAAAAALLPVAARQPQASQPTDAKPAADPQDGYQLTQHVARYYETARV